MHWIIQKDFLKGKPGWERLLETLERFGMEHSFHAVAPKVGNLSPVAVLSHGNVICYGSYSMRHAAVGFGWSPGVFDLFSQDFEQQRTRWGIHMLNYGSSVCALNDAECGSESMFVRPVADTKSFAGKVFSPEEFRGWKASVCNPERVEGHSSLSPETLVQLCRPVTIHAEYRFWIVRGRIITQSVYKRGSQVFYDSEVDECLAEFVRARIKEWQPHDAFVLDVCDTENGMKIVEINTINCSAFYAADVQQLVLVMESEFTN